MVIGEDKKVIKKDFTPKNIQICKIEQIEVYLWIEVSIVKIFHDTLNGILALNRPLKMGSL